MRKIATLAATYGVPVVPHANETCRNAIHLLFAQPHRICPLAEWGVKINHNVQYFYKDFYQPVDGYFHLPPGPGFGYELDLSKQSSKPSSEPRYRAFSAKTRFLVAEDRAWKPSTLATPASWSRACRSARAPTAGRTAPSRPPWAWRA